VVRVGVIGLVADAGIFLAQEGGYFAQAGIRLDTSQFSTAADMMAPLGTGQMDVATGGLNAGLYNSIGRGVPMVMVADKGSQPPGFGANVLVVRKDLLDSGQVTSLKDLKGRPVGVDIPGTLNRYLWDKSLMTEGLRLSDVQMQVLTFPDMVSALANKGIDAALAPEPFPTLMEARGVGTKFLTTDKVAENSQPGVIIYSRDFATRQPEVAQRWMTAYLRGVRDYNRALAAGGQARQDLVQVLVKYTTLKDPAVYDKMVWFGLDPNGRLFKDSILDFQQWLRDNGTLDQIVPWEQLVDTRFVDEAVKELGPYQP
jgi:NitT/TauT family transport system substrate-binding protein